MSRTASPRMAAAFERLRREGRKALIPFVTAGDPIAGPMPALMHALVAGGADVIELGVPFSDPSADGPVIQRATERALADGVSLRQVLEMVSTFRTADAQTPVVLMGYANPIERYEQRHGSGTFARDAHAAGVDGVLVVDVPPEECAALSAQMREAGIDLIFLLAPTSSEARMAHIGAFATGYVYYVSLKGVTGAGHLDVGDVAAMLPRIRRHVHVPVGVGFGIRDAASAQAVARVADGVVIGSRLIEILQRETRDNAPHAARAFMAEIRQALDEIGE